MPYADRTIGYVTVSRPLGSQPGRPRGPLPNVGHVSNVPRNPDQTQNPHGWHGDTTDEDRLENRDRVRVPLFCLHPWYRYAISGICLQIAVQRSCKVDSTATTFGNEGVQRGDASDPNLTQ